MRQGETHVFRLVQLLRWDDSVLITGQIAGEGLESDDTYIMWRCMNVCRHAHRKNHYKRKGSKIKITVREFNLPKTYVKKKIPTLHTYIYESILFR